MTELIYMENTDLFEYQNSKIEEIDSIKEDSRKTIILDKTIFYPQGGGQPYDTGTIFNKNCLFNVEEVRFIDEKVFHIGKYKYGTFSENDIVNLKIDKERRVLNSKLHTVGHLLDEVVSILELNLTPIKGKHFPGDSFVKFEGSLDIEKIPEIIKNIECSINNLITKGFKVKNFMTSRSELEKICENVPDYIPKGKPVRVSIVNGNRATPCGGTHINDINQIEKVEITKIKSKKGFTSIFYNIV